MSVEIRPLCDADMRLLSASLRDIDRLEVASAIPSRPVEEALVDAARATIRGRAGYWGGGLVACWGVVPRGEVPAEGAPWLLATSALESPDARRAFLGHGEEEMRRLAEGFERLWNLVHRDNGIAQRWLRFMGFEFRDSREYLLSGEPFVKFEMEFS